MPAWDYTEPRWRMVLSTLGGTNLGEISDARDRKFTFAHLRPQSVEFTLPMSHPMIYELLYRQHVLIKLYCEDTLAMVAETVSLQTVSGDKGTKVVAVEAPWIRLQKRLFAKTPDGVTYTAVEPTAILNSIMVTVNLESDTGVSVGTRVAVPGTYTVGPVRY